ncbi:MAG TPA: VCBS repeat-containing protein, partial [Verrucomicrobiae bacterium]|nr:VCBS repeat-containing protein [Verrucomicrobiae bacterium]
MSLARMTSTACALLGAALLGAVPALAATCPPITLQPRFPVPTAQGPNEVVAADVNGDGVLDLVLTNVDGNTVSILPGIAPGATFGPRIDLTVASTPNSVQVADLDGDGNPDLIVGDLGALGIQVLRGLGGGSFGAPTTFSTGTMPYEIALGDFNHDGVTDVALADNNVSSMRILLGGKNDSGHWDGTFAPAAVYPTNDLPLGIITGDFNEDGITDIVVTEYNANTVALFLGNGSGGAGDGTFQPAVHFPAGVVPYDLATGDFNHDGHLDLAVSNSGWGGVHVLLGSGTGTFPTTNAYIDGQNCAGIAPADFDGDGITDLAVDDCVNNQLLLLKGQGSGGIGSGTFAAPVVLGDCCFPVHVIAADLDGNGKPDAVTCGYQSSSLGLFRDGCVPDPNMPHITRI